MTGGSALAAALGVLRRDLEYLLTDRDGRFATPTPDVVAAASLCSLPAASMPALTA